MHIHKKFSFWGVQRKGYDQHVIEVPSEQEQVNRDLPYLDKGALRRHYNDLLKECFLDIFVRDYPLLIELRIWDGLIGVITHNFLRHFSLII